MFSLAKSRVASSCCFFLVAACLQWGLFVAVFDIYFSSPVRLDTVRSFRPSLLRPPAKRLVLIVSDGLRAESLFGNSMAATPHLREVAMRRGVWGVSHAEIPTETRTGHVAVLAGVQEGGSSALTWLERGPVRFDHLFNRSSDTFAWGRKELLTLFQVPSRVHAVTISSTIEEFYEDYFILQWFQNEVTHFLSNATPAQKRRLRSQDGLVFFLHVSATNLAGKTYKPQSARFRETLHMLDAAVALLERVVARFFGHDNRTAFLLTSDHGATDAGSHGGGQAAETNTPLLAWGAGVRDSRADPAAGRVDVAQVDLCPLMAALLGLAMPTSNQGRLPVGLLNVSASHAVAMLAANTRQIVELFRAGWSQRRQQSPFFYKAARLTPEDAEQRLKAAEIMAMYGKTARASAELDGLARAALLELELLQRSDRTFHTLCVTVIFLMWSLSLALSLLPPSPTKEVVPQTKEKLFFVSLIVSQCFMLLIEQRSLLHWFYRLTPIFLFWTCWRLRNRLLEAPWSSGMVTKLLCIVAGLEIVVCGFFYRALFGLAVVLNSASQLRTADPNLKTKAGLAFLTSSLALALFALLPPCSSTRYVNPTLVAVGPLATAALCSALLYRRHRKEHLSRGQLLFFALLLWLVILALVLVYTNYYTWKLPDDFRGRVLLYCVLFFFCATCFFTSTPLAVLSLWLSVTIAHSLVSINYEALFLLFLHIHVSSWVAMETNFLEQRFLGSCWTSIFALRPNIHLNKIDSFSGLRICFTIFLLLHVSFFATENFDSISSLHRETTVNVAWYGCTVDVIVTVFAFKIFLSLFLTACVSLVMTANIEITSITKIFIIFGNFNAAQFFFLIRDEGSWYDTGRYATCLGTGLATALLLGLARLLLGRSFRASLSVKP